MYCPKCKCEYREGFTTCSDCKLKLVEQLPEEPEKVYEDINVVKIGTYNELEVDLIMELLNNNNIPCYKKSHGAGEYLNISMGFNIYGEDIFVADKDYQKAIAILENLSVYKAPIDPEDNHTIYHIPFYKRHKIITRIILVALIITVIISVVISTFF
jgi:hypothetical protein